MPKKIAAIVVTYNRKAILLENIGCLMQQGNPDLDIIIVDNAGADGTETALKPYVENGEILYFNTGANLGGAGGFNYGIRRAIELGYECLWMMDDDCMPRPDALEKLLEADGKLGGEYGFLSSMALWKDGTICQMNIQRHPMTRKITDFSGEIIPATVATFVSLFIKSSTVKELGLPIKEFFIWTDDWEYTRRISQRYKSYVVPNSVVIHKLSKNAGADIATDSLDRSDRYLCRYRNDVYLYRQEGIKGFAYQLIKLAVHCARVIFKAPDHKLARLKIIFGGTIAGFGFHPEIEYPDKNAQPL